jgi:hypothetical protein
VLTPKHTQADYELPNEGYTASTNRRSISAVGDGNRVDHAVTFNAPSCVYVDVNSVGFVSTQRLPLRSSVPLIITGRPAPCAACA